MEESMPSSSVSEQEEPSLVSPEKSKLLTPKSPLSVPIHLAAFLPFRET
jgi:hypothetical protein